MLIESILAIAIGLPALSGPTQSLQPEKGDDIGRGTTRSADGVSIAFRSRGEGSTAVVFIHGGFSDSSLWTAQMRFLAGRYRTVAIDLAGHGSSGSDRLNWGLEPFGEDVRSVVDALGLKRVVLVGHSMGGPVALEAASILADRTAGIIAVDTLQDAGLKRDWERWKGRVELFRREFGSVCGPFARSLFHSNAGGSIVEAVEKKVCGFPAERAADILGSFTGYEMSSAMARAKAPIRGIHGDLYPTDAEGNRRFSPGYRATVMENVGHFPMLERPEEFNRLLMQHLEDLFAGR